MKNNKLGISAVIGVILMVAFTVAIAAVVFFYVSDVFVYKTERERFTDFMNNELELKKQSCNCSATSDYIHGWNDAFRLARDYAFPEQITNMTGAKK